MSRRTAWTIHTPALLVAMFLLVIFVVAWFAPEASRAGKVFGLLAGLIPTVIAGHQYAYARVASWRLRTNRWRLTLLNPESNWSITAEFDVPDSQEALLRVNELLRSERRGRAKLLSESAHRCVWTWNDVTLLVRRAMGSDPMFGDTPVIRVELPPVRRGFRGLEASIKDQLGPLLAQMERATDASARKYVVNLGFAGANPYFGLFITNVNRDLVARFDIEYFETTPTDRDRVRVHEDHIELVTSTAHSAERLSLRYLGLQSVHGE